MRVLSSLRSLTVDLQKRSSDILAAYEHVSEVITDLELLKTNCEEEFHLLYCEIKTLADELNIPIATPRIAARQAHRSNIPADSPDAYYRRNLVIPHHHRVNQKVWTNSTNESKTSWSYSIRCCYIPSCLGYRGWGVV